MASSYVLFAVQLLVVPIFWKIFRPIDEMERISIDKMEWQLNCV